MKIHTNSPNTAHQRGNAMIYVLVALALFGFLTLTLSKQNDQTDGQDLSDEMAELYANELVSYANAAQQSIDMMLASGSDVSDLDFVIPSSAAFNTPPHYHKVFHPQGGGLSYEKTYNQEIKKDANSAWFLRNNIKVEWTPTAADDVTLFAWNIKEPVCRLINKEITGTETIPTLDIDLDKLFDPSSFTASDFTAARCAGCEGYPVLCISNTGASSFGLYSVIADQ